MIIRWLILYRTHKGEQAARIMLDAELNPFETVPSQIAPDCQYIYAIVPLPDDCEIDVVSMGGDAVMVSLPEEDDEDEEEDEEAEA